MSVYKTLWPCRRNLSVQTLQKGQQQLREAGNQWVASNGLQQIYPRTTNIAPIVYDHPVWNPLGEKKREKTHGLTLL